MLEDALSDHFPIMIKLDINKKTKITSKLKIIFCRDIDRIVTSELKDALEEQDCHIFEGHCEEIWKSFKF